MYLVIGVFTFIISAISCREFFGDHPLGNNFSLLDGDKKEDRIIVYCAGNEENECNGGIFVIPRYRDHMLNGKYAEYVETAKSNNDWIIAKSFQMNYRQEKYWIINKNFNIKNLDCDKTNCDSIIQSHVIGPLNINEFQEKIKKFRIDLSFVN